MKSRRDLPVPATPPRAVRRTTTLRGELEVSPHAPAWVAVGVGALAVGFASLAAYGVAFRGSSWVDRGAELALAALCVAAFVIAREQPAVAARLAFGGIWVGLIGWLVRTGPNVGSIVVLPALIVGAGFVLGAPAAGGLTVATAIAVPIAVAGHALLVGESLGDLFFGQAWFLPTEGVVIGLGLGTRAVIGSYERALALSETSRRRYRALFENAPDGVLEVDARGLILEANPVARAMLGLWRLGERLDDVADAIGAGPIPRVTASPVCVTVTGPDGGARVWEVAGQNILDAGASRSLLVIRDVTERRAIEDRLFHAQRLETVGQIVGSVAHDFNNLLTVVGGNASILVPHADPEVREVALEIVDAQARGVALTRQLLSFARRDVRQSEVLDLSRLVLDLRRMLGRLIGERHRLILDEGGPAAVLGDRNQFEQVVVNLVVNARDSMPAGGAIVVRVRELGAEEASALGAPGGLGRQVMLEVRDEGVGMTPVTKSRIFEAFFTTKPRGRGTGLGLATVQGVVTDALGQLAVESALGAGSTFRVFLPAMAPAAVRRRTSQDADAPRGRGERIVVVDGDPAVCDLARRVLRTAGYVVVVATDAAQALAAAATPVDLLLTDVSLPESGGAEIARAIAGRQGPTLTIFMSGIAADPRDLPAGAVLLAKPFDVHRLLRVIRAGLDNELPGARVGSLGVHGPPVRC